MTTDSPPTVLADRDGVPLAVGNCFRDNKHAAWSGSGDIRQIREINPTRNTLSVHTSLMPDGAFVSWHGNVSGRMGRAQRITCDACPHLLSCTLLGQTREETP